MDSVSEQDCSRHGCRSHKEQFQVPTPTRGPQLTFLSFTFLISKNNMVTPISQGICHQLTCYTVVYLLIYLFANLMSLAATVFSSLGNEILVASLLCSPGRQFWDHRKNPTESLAAYLRSCPA